MSERIWSTGGMLLVGTKSNYSDKLPVPRCLPQILHGRIWDATWTFAERGWVLTARAMAWHAVVFFLQNYLILKYKSKDSLSLNRLWAISILQCGKSGEQWVLHTTGNLPIPRCSDRRNAGHSLQYLSTGQELYRFIGCQWYLGYFATASNWADYSRSFAELGSVRQDTCKWWGRWRQVKTSWLFRFSDYE